MKNLHIDNLNDFLDVICAKHSHKPCLCDIQGNSYSYGNVLEKVDSAAALFTSLKVTVGDRIALIASSSPQWVIAYFAILRIGCIAVPILPDFTSQDIENIIEEAEPKAVFACKDNEEKVLAICQNKKPVVGLTSNQFDAEIITLCEDNFLQDKINSSDNCTVNNESCASIIYTSGTSGHSKGVVLTHSNLLANLNSAQQLIDINPTWRFLSILPLSHVYEFTIGMLLPLSRGAAIHYLMDLPTPKLLEKACAVVKPDVICMVPLVLEKIYKKKIQPVLKKNKVYKYLLNIDLAKSVFFKILGKKIALFFGGNIKLFAIGGAAINSNTEHFLKTSGLPYLVGYGLTEASPLISGGPFEDRTISIGSVGKIVPNVEVRLENTDSQTGIGEIYARGPNIMRGYLNNDILTRETIDPDKWLKTGDLGYFDGHENLILTGRLKNVIVLSNGENVYPEELEEKLHGYLSVSEAIVHEHEGALQAIIVPDYEYISKKHELNVEQVASGGNQIVLDEIETVRRKVNKMLPGYAKIRSTAEQTEPFIKTATHKVKRYLYNG